MRDVRIKLLQKMPKVRATHTNYRAGPTNVLVHENCLRWGSAAVGGATIRLVSEHRADKLPEDQRLATVHCSSYSPHVRVTVSNTRRIGVRVHLIVLDAAEDR